MKLSRNIALYYIDRALSGLIFTLPIWVAFQHRYLSYIQMSWLQSVALLLQFSSNFLLVHSLMYLEEKGDYIIGSLQELNIFVGFSSNPTTMIIGLLMVAIGTTFLYLGLILQFFMTLSNNLDERMNFQK